jgi:spore germination protein KB
MTAKHNITSVQLLLMSVGSALMFPYTFMPILNTPHANQDVWIVMIISVFYIFIISFPVLILINKFRGINLNEMTEMILGKFFGKVVSFLFFTFFLFCYTACMLIGAIFVGISVLPGTPIWAVLIFAFAAVSFSAYKGAGTIGRLATFIVPFVMLTIIVFLLMGLGLMDFKNLQPVFADSTLLQLNLGAFYTGARYSEILIYLVFSFFLMKKASINKTYAKSLVVFFVFFAMILIPTILVLGISFAKNMFNPYFEYTGQVHAYDFIQRVQSINALAWFPGLLLKLTIYNFMASYTLSGIFKTKSHKTFVIPVTIMSFLICMIPMMQKSSVIMLLASDQVFPWIILPFTFVLPLFILIMYFVRRDEIREILKKRKTDAALSESTICQATETDGGK